jgi:hypothetical protein
MEECLSYAVAVALGLAVLYWALVLVLSLVFWLFWLVVGAFLLLLVVLDFWFGCYLLPNAHPLVMWAFWGGIWGGLTGFWTVAQVYGMADLCRWLTKLVPILMLAVGFLALVLHHG